MKKIALSLFVIAASGAYVWDQAGKGPAEDLLGSTLPTGDVQTGSIQRRVESAAIAEPTIPPQPAPLATREATVSPDDGEPTAVASLAAAEPADQSPAPIAPPVSTLADAPQPPAPSESASSPVVADAPAAPASTATAAVAVPTPRLRPAYHPAPVRVASASPARVTPATPVRVTPASMTVAAGGGSYADGAFTGPAVDAYYGLVQIQAIVQNGRLVGIKVLRYPSDRRTSVAINRQALPMLRDEVITAQSANVDIISGATLTSEAFIRSLHAALSQATA